MANIEAYGKNIVGSGGSGGGGLTQQEHEWLEELYDSIGHEMTVIANANWTGGQTLTYDLDPVKEYLFINILTTYGNSTQIIKIPRNCASIDQVEYLRSVQYSMTYSFDATAYRFTIRQSSGYGNGAIFAVSIN